MIDVIVKDITRMFLSHYTSFSLPFIRYLRVIDVCFCYAISLETQDTIAPIASVDVSAGANSLYSCPILFCLRASPMGLLSGSWQCNFDDEYSRRTLDPYDLSVAKYAIFRATRSFVSNGL